MLACVISLGAEVALLTIIEDCTGTHSVRCFPGSLNCIFSGRCEFVYGVS